MIRISAILCAHNADPVRLRRVVQSIQSQTLPQTEWEFLIVDNASSEPLNVEDDLISIPNSRIVRENQLGLTWARLRGMKEAKGDVLIYIDDDNILQNDYFAQAVKLSQSWSILGAWGGQILPEYEVELNADLKPYESLLAVLEVSADVWCNFRHPKCLPRGAGLVVRRSVVTEYEKRVLNSDLRQRLERQGSDLASCGDSDLCFTALDLGFGVGIFRRLQLVHVIPSRRTTVEYLLRMEESMSYSWTILNFLYDKPNKRLFRHPVRRCVDFFRTTMANRVARKFLRASARGRKRALALISSVQREECLSGSDQ